VELRCGCRRAQQTDGSNRGKSDRQGGGDAATPSLTGARAINDSEEHDAKGRH
jgi:hypothetical protein